MSAARPFRCTVAMAILLVTLSANAKEPPGWLGFGYLRHVEPKAKVKQWLYVHRLDPAGPAQTAGLRLQDVVIAIDGKPLQFASDTALLDFFSAIRPGQTVRLTVMRGAAPHVIALRARPMPKALAERWQRNYALAQKRGE
ncbi:MAG TPA: PDZ domain-containing protein [Thermoanaerobaculia bacterium]